MSRRPCLPSVLFLVLLLVLLLGLSAFSQESVAPLNPPAAADREAPTARQAAMSMLEQVLAGTAALTLPQNRLAIELEAFPTISVRSQARARALINQMVAEFSQAASQSDPSHGLPLPKLRQERATIITALAQTDAELALQFLTSTLSYVQPRSPKDDAVDDQDMLLQLATQIANHDPRRAMQMAEQQLQSNDPLAASLIALLDQVERSDPQTGAQLFHEFVQRVKQTDLVGEDQNLSFAASLLASQFNRQSESGSAPDDALRSLAECVAAAAASPQFEQRQMYTLSDAWPALGALVPARVTALRQKSVTYGPVISSQHSFWQDFNAARSSGDADQAVRLIEKLPEDQRSAIAQQAVWQFANSGDLERTQAVAESLDPWQRNNAIQLALRSAATAAAGRGDFAAARQYAAQVTDEEDRAMLLSQLALGAKHGGRSRLAGEILEEATSLVINHTGLSAFSAQLAIAQAYLLVNPAQSIPLLERSATQLEQVLTAAAQLDGFLPDQRSFEGSELVLNRGFLYQSLIQPYALATADLATIDLATARTLAGRLPLPEARLMTELIVARGVLDRDSQNSNNQAHDSRALLLPDSTGLR